MFEYQVSDAAVVAAITEGARAEAAAAARRLAAIAELVARRADGPTESAHWSCDYWDAVAAEVAAAQHISHAMASGQMYLALALRDRLPQVGALFAEGAISVRLASAMVWHTELIKDPDTLKLVDARLAQDAARFGPLSVTKTAQAIDAVVDRHDPGALRRSRAGARGRQVVINPADRESGTACLWGSLFAADAAVLERRLTQMAHAVCDDDPRTLAQRRADALGRWPPAPTTSRAAAPTPTARPTWRPTRAPRRSSCTWWPTPPPSTPSPTRTPPVSAPRGRSPRR